MESIVSEFMYKPVSAKGGLNDYSCRKHTSQRPMVICDVQGSSLSNLGSLSIEL